MAGRGHAQSNQEGSSHGLNAMHVMHYIPSAGMATAALGLVASASCSTCVVCLSSVSPVYVCSVEWLKTVHCPERMAQLWTRMTAAGMLTLSEQHAPCCEDVVAVLSKESCHLASLLLWQD